MKEQRRWNAKYDNAYNEIPLFSAPYKIRAVGAFGSFSVGPNSYNTYNLFLKTHGQVYLLTVQNSSETMTLVQMNAKEYLTYIDGRCEIMPIEDKDFNARNFGGVIINDVLDFQDDGSSKQYRINLELDLEYLLGERLSKREFIYKLFEKDELEKADPTLFNGSNSITARTSSKKSSTARRFDGLLRDIREGGLLKKSGSSVIGSERDFGLDELIHELMEDMMGATDDTVLRRTQIIDDEEYDSGDIELDDDYYDDEDDEYNEDRDDEEYWDWDDER